MSQPLPRIVHQGFDTIEVAFQGILPPSVRRVLAILKERARERGEAVLAQLGDGGLECHVFGTGLGTGNHNYTWRLQSASGLIWAWNDSDDIELWNGRVKAGAEILLTLGYAATRDQIWRELAQLGAMVPQHSIGRADYCIDFLAPDFSLTLERVVCHYKMKEGQHAPEARELAKADNVYTNFSSRRCQSLRLGSVSLLQLAVYNKRREVIQQGKDFWWEAWKLDKTDARAIVWRVEVRAGKELLRDRYNIRTFADLENSVGDVYAEALRRVRLLAEDASDKNVTRAPLDPLWKAARAAIGDGLADNHSGLCPHRARFLVRERATRNAANAIIGGALSWLAIGGVSKSNLLDSLRVVSGTIRAMVEQTISRDPDKYAEALADRVDRYHFIAPRPAGWGRTDALANVDG